MSEQVIDAVAELNQTGLAQFLTFRLKDDVYGINILQIREIIDYGNVTKVPMMPGSIAGVINLRGSVVPVVELSRRFDDSPAAKTKFSSIVILELEQEQEKIVIGVTVDVVNEVIDIAESEIKQAPSFGTKIRADFIEGMGRMGDELLVILKLETLLSVQELSVVNEMTSLG